MEGGVLVWMDLEMSGLDPERERILEVAAIVTDGALDVIAEGPNLVVHQSDELLGAMDEWNTSHHGQSGLTDRVRASTLTETAAEDELLAFVAKHCNERSAPLAGNSIHHDRRFLAKYMPRLERYLHYRNVDVSTVKELVRRWYPELVEKVPKKRSTHRALDDIRESIEELRWYKKNVFR